jgi:N-acetylneuraminic acid mutarotase
VVNRRRLGRWLLVGVLAAGFVFAAAVIARELPARSILGLVGEGECEPTLASTRFPDNAASEDGRWEAAGTYPIRRDEVRAATVAGRIYVGTGLSASEGRFQAHDELFSFDPAGDSYQSLPDVPVSVDHAALVGHRGMLYVIGGYVDDAPSSAVWRFSPKVQRWEALPAMRIARGSPAAAVVGDRIYVIGGSQEARGVTSEGALSAVEIYDIGTGEWTRGPSMPTARHHHGAAAVNGRIVVAGGRNRDDLSLDVVEQLDTASGRWASLAPLPLGSGGLAVVATPGHVLAIGGGDDTELWVTPATWALDPAAENAWRRLADLDVARHGHGAAVLGSDVYVFGGAPCPGYGRTEVVESLRTTAGAAPG